MHEALTSFRKISASSNRWFGFTFAGLFIVLAVWPWIFHHGEVRWGFVAAALISSLVAQFFPAWITPLNQAWFKLGIGLNKIVNPIFMGLMFYGVMVPFGLFLRGKDFLRLKSGPENASYWLLRDPPGPSGESLHKQF